MLPVFNLLCGCLQAGFLVSHLCSHTFQKHPLILQNFFKMSAPIGGGGEKAEFYSEHASQARIPTVRVSARPMEAGVASRKSQRY